MTGRVRRHGGGRESGGEGRDQIVRVLLTYLSGWRSETRQSAKPDKNLTRELLSAYGVRARMRIRSRRTPKVTKLYMCCICLLQLSSSFLCIQPHCSTEIYHRREQAQQQDSSNNNMPTHLASDRSLRRTCPHRHIPLHPLTPLQRHAVAALHGNGDSVHEVCADCARITPRAVAACRMMYRSNEPLRRLAQAARRLDCKGQVHRSHRVRYQLVLVELTLRRLLRQLRRSRGCSGQVGVGQGICFLYLYMTASYTCT